MAEIIERLTGKPLDVLAGEYVFSPLEMSRTMYRPAKNFGQRLRRQRWTTSIAIG